MIERGRYTSGRIVVGTPQGPVGRSHVLAILPALALSSDATPGAYMLCFGMGSLLAMGTFASIVGWVANRPRGKARSASRPAPRTSSSMQRSSVSR